MQSREIKLSRELIKMLSKKRKKSQLLFITYFHHPFTAKKIGLAINEFNKKMGYPRKWRLFHLRHSFAVNFLAKGGSMKKLQEILGRKLTNEYKAAYRKAAAKRINQQIKLTPP